MGGYRMSHRSRRRRAPAAFEGVRRAISLVGRRIELHGSYLDVDYGKPLNPAERRATQHDAMLIGVAGELHGETCFADGSRCLQTRCRL